MQHLILSESLGYFFEGFLLYGSLIIVVGPQNLFILRQGLMRQFRFTTAFVSIFVDSFLITFGIGGVGAFISSESQILTIVSLVGILFLILTGGRSLINACRARTFGDKNKPGASILSRRATIVAALSFSLLNPGAYLDTFVMLGSRSGAFQIDERVLFGIGALLASAFWFFALAFGASRLTPIFRRPAAWRLLDLVSSCIMFGVAGVMAYTLLV